MGLRNHCFWNSRDFLVGLITLRLREDFLAISTFGIAISIQLVALNVESVTRGPNGFYALPKPFCTYLRLPICE